MKTAPKNSKSPHFITEAVRGVRDESARDSSPPTFGRESLREFDHSRLDRRGK